jgi:hypothetical protein
MNARARSLLLFALATPAAALIGCDTADPTRAVVENGYPPPPDGAESQQTAVVKAWWSVTLFADPVAAGASSAEERVVPASDHAYALLAPGWSPLSPVAPSTLVVVRTREKVDVGRGGTARITISPATTVGDCDAGSTLTQEEADFITQRIFPGDFAGQVYDASRCVTTSDVLAGADGGHGAKD